MKKMKHVRQIERSLSVKRIKSQKRYSLLILSIMILTCALMQVGFQMFRGIQNTYLEIRKDAYGEWERLFAEIDTQMESIINKNPFVTKKGKIEIYGVLSGDYIENKQLNIGTIDETAWDLGRLKLSKGRLPQKENEIAVEYSTLVAMGYEDSLGEEIVLSILPSVEFKSRGTAEVESSDYVYTLCGIIKDYQVNWEVSTRHRLPTGIVTTEGGSRIGAALETHMLVWAQDKIVYDDMKKSKKITCDIEENISQESFASNIPYKNVLDQIRLLIAGGAVCVLFVTIAHSIDEREQFWAFLSALGMERRQIYQMIFWEAVLYFLASILIGTVGGLALYGLAIPAFEIIIKKEMLRKIFWQEVGASLLCSALVISIGYFFSCMKLNKYLKGGQKKQKKTASLKERKRIKNHETSSTFAFTPLAVVVHQWRHTPMKKVAQILMLSSVFLMVGLAGGEIAEKLDSLDWMKQVSGNSYYLHTEEVPGSKGIKKGTVGSLKQIAGVESVAVYYTTDGYEDFTVNLSGYPDSDYLQKVIETQKSYADGESTTLANIPLKALGVDQWKDIERFRNNLSEGAITREDFESGDFCILVLPPLRRFKTYDSSGNESVNYLPITNPDLENGIVENRIKTGDFLSISHCVTNSEGIITEQGEQQIQVDAILRTMKYEDTYTPLLGSSGITIITGAGFWKRFGIDSVDDYYQIAKVLVSDDAEALDTEAHITRVLKKNSTIIADNNYETYKAEQQSLYSFVGMFSIFAVFYLILVSVVLYQMAEAEAHQRQKSMAVFKALGMEEGFLKRMCWTELLLKVFFSTITAIFILICYYITKARF